MLMASGLKMLLEMWGFDVTLAHDGVSALAAIRDVQPRAALLDLLMPRLDVCGYFPDIVANRAFGAERLALARVGGIS
jgi:DNA-binding response OmpR family regulator